MVASDVSLRTAVAVGIVSYLLFSWVIPDLADRLPCSADGEESMLISLEDYSMLLPNDYQMAELPFQRRVHPCRVFSDTYQEARTTFLEAAQALKEPFAERNPNPLSVQVHQLTVFTDDNDQKYTTDIVVLPGNQPGLVVHSSGVHGVEGYAGSAIQVAFLHLVRQFYEDGQLLRHPTVVLVHAVNPVGMARYRRVNERNVDLNRNGLQPDEWSGPYVASNPNRDNYDRFSASLFNPATPPTVWSATIGYVIKAAGAVLRYGLPQLKAAMVRGQYHDPTGIFYGGKDQPEPSLTLLQDWLEHFLRNNNSNGTLATGAVTWVDVHTGLGPFGSTRSSRQIIRSTATGKRRTLMCGSISRPALRRTATRHVRWHKATNISRDSSMTTTNPCSPSSRTP